MTILLCSEDIVTATFLFYCLIRTISKKIKTIRILKQILVFSPPYMEFQTSLEQKCGANTQFLYNESEEPYQMSMVPST